MIKRIVLVSILISAVFFVGCDTIQPLTRQESDDLEKIRSGHYDLVDKEELARLRSVGRYQLREQGRQTFRLDTVTGKVCLALATPDVWKTQNLLQWNVTTPIESTILPEEHNCGASGTPN